METVRSADGSKRGGRLGVQGHQYPDRRPAYGCPRCPTPSRVMAAEERARHLVPRRGRGDARWSTAPTSGAVQLDQESLDPAVGDMTGPDDDDVGDGVDADPLLVSVENSRVTPRVVRSSRARRSPSRVAARSARMPRSCRVAPSAPASADRGSRTGRPPSLPMTGDMLPRRSARDAPGRSVRERSPGSEVVNGPARKHGSPVKKVAATVRSRSRTARPSSPKVMSDDTAAETGCVSTPR